MCETKGELMPAANMKIRSGKSHKTVYRRSVNLERDHVASESTSEFIVTECAKRCLRRILEGLTPAASAHAWTLTGPFGTGKSSFCLYLTQLLASGRAASESRSEIIS